MSNILSINSNVASLNAQRHLARNTQGLQRVSERLSSGLRITRASDDAAGLSIASALQADSRVYTQAIRNGNDGISELSIAEGAIDQLKSVVVRIRELATQAASGTLGAAQRGALHTEAVELSEEYNRILGATEFNGVKLFEAASASFTVQLGYGSAESITATLTTGTQTTDTIRASVSSSGTEANGLSDNVAVSADGRYIAFVSAATNVVAGDTNGATDVFRRDTVTGVTTRVSVSSSGVQGNAQCYGISISADGRYVMYTSSSTNLVAGDTNGADDVFVHDVETGITRRANVGNGGTQANNYALQSSISADGRYVSYASDATNLVSGDTNATTDIFVTDLLNNTTRRVSVSSSGAQGNGTSVGSSISADGRYVAFRSGASNLVAGDTNGVDDIFVHDTLLGVTTRVNVNSSGAQSAVLAGNPMISADGRYVGFTSDASDLVSDDTNGVGDVFVHDLQTRTTMCISRGANGVEGNAAAGGAAISADGRYVAFLSGSNNLVSGDTNGVNDVFVRDIITGTTTCVSINANGTFSNGASSLPEISADGQFVVYSSSGSNLVSGDANGVNDIFRSKNTALSFGAGFATGIRALGGFSLKQATLARMAQGTIDGYLTELNAAVGNIGASMSRLSSAIANLTILTENIASAASQILDTDVATEAADLVRANILQNAAAAVLAQANQNGALVLELLRD